MKKLLFTIIYLFSFLVYGQKTIIDGQLHKFNDPSHIYLAENMGGKYTIIDSCEINDTGKFTFLREFQTGYYAIWISASNFAPIIINQEDSIQLNFSDTDLRNSIHVIKSKENQLFWDFVKIRKQKKSEIAQVYMNKTAYPEGSKENLYYSLKEDSLNKNYKQYILQLVKNNSESFFSKTIIADIETNANEPFFKYIDFTNPDLIRSGVITKRITDYLQFNTEYTEDGFSSSIDEILKLSSVNHEVYEFVLNYLLELFHAVGPDVVLDYIVENYVLDDACSDLSISDIISNQIESYKKIRPGEIAPNVSIFNIKGYVQNLHDICSFKKINVLFFGSSHCQFCINASETFMHSDLINNPDIQIIYISLDTQINDIYSIAKEKPDNWVFLTELKAWDSKSTALFKIHKTPSFFILDSKANILSRPKTVQELLKEVEFIK